MFLFFLIDFYYLFIYIFIYLLAALSLPFLCAGFV